MNLPTPRTPKPTLVTPEHRAPSLAIKMLKSCVDSTGREHFAGQVYGATPESAISLVTNGLALAYCHDEEAGTAWGAAFERAHMPLDESTARLLCGPLVDHQAELVAALAAGEAEAKLQETAEAEAKAARARELKLLEEREARAAEERAAAAKAEAEAIAAKEALNNEVAGAKSQADAAKLLAANESPSYVPSSTPDATPPASPGASARQAKRGR